MSLKLGIHTGPQDLSMEELLRVWRRADEAGFHWASVWDHFYANPLNQREDPCFEGVASMAALAGATTNMRVGCLVFCALFRNPSLLAKAAVTIDHLSGGRAEIGIGAGWFEEEFREFGYDFPPLGQRFAQLEETLQIVRSLWREPVTDFEGKHYQLSGAVCSPKPLNPNLRIWVGGNGPRRTPRLAAQYADGYNVPYQPPEIIRERLDALEQACERLGRDPAEIETSVNLRFHMRAHADDSDADPPDNYVPGSITGTTQQAIDRIGEYVETGVGGLNIAFRPPINWDAFEAYIEDVLPVFHPASA